MDIVFVLNVVVGIRFWIWGVFGIVVIVNVNVLSVIVVGSKFCDMLVFWNSVIVKG